METGHFAGLLPLVTIAVIALASGYAVGASRSRRARRKLQRALGARNLDLLDARAEQSRLLAQLESAPKRERLVRLMLQRLRAARERERRRFIDESALKLRAAESADRARRAARLARASSARIRELERALDAANATGTITTRGPKSYGNGQAVTVNVVDHETRTARRDTVTRVSHHDRTRLSRLAPSNEAQRAPNADAPTDELALIDGLAESDARYLRSLGISDLEQLAALSADEQRPLREHVVETLGPRPLGAWIGNARALIVERAPI